MQDLSSRKSTVLLLLDGWMPMFEVIGEEESGAAMPAVWEWDTTTSGCSSPGRNMCKVDINYVLSSHYSTTTSVFPSTQVKGRTSGVGRQPEIKIKKWLITSASLIDSFKCKTLDLVWNNDPCSTQRHWKYDESSPPCLVHLHWLGWSQSLGWWQTGCYWATLAPGLRYYSGGQNWRCFLHLHL